MKLKLLALLLLSSAPMLGARVFFGFGVAAPAPVYSYGYYAPPPVYYAPPAPYYPANVWINGYYYPYGGRWAWRAGYYARPPYAGAFWVAPRYYGGRYYGGHWGHR